MDSRTGTETPQPRSVTDDGQPHPAFGNAGPETGQMSISNDAKVGNLSGGETHDRIPPTRKDADVKP